MKTIVAIQTFFVLLFCTGWCLSLYKLTQCDFEPPYKAEIIYGSGLVFPISVVTGWMDFGK